MTTSEYNMHGVSAVVEFAVPQARIVRNTLGTALVQPANTENWLHLALQTPKEVRQSLQLVHYIKLTARTNENARIDILRLSDKNGILYQFDQLGIVNQNVDRKFDVPDRQFDGTNDNIFFGGLVLSIHVEFLTGTPVGRVELRSGGTGQNF